MEPGAKVNTEMKKFIQYGFAFFCLLLLALMLAINWKDQKDSRKLLFNSIESQLISISAGAREIIDPDQFAGYNQPADIANNPAYDRTLSKLRQLANSTQAKYIYALKKIDDSYVFIFDTDPVDPAVFGSYEIAPVHMEAFRGKEASGVMNMKDEYGSFNTGAVPILKDEKVIGIVATDTDDHLVAQNLAETNRNTWLLTGVVATVMAIMFGLLHYLLHRIKQMQDNLTRIAHYDTVTGLPNRRFLLESLGRMGQDANRNPFALLFIDLDNFKGVNDQAGHDAGDALLSRIGGYLSKFTRVERHSTQVYRPGAGKLNVAARIGGDEFILVVPHVANAEDAAAFTGRLLVDFQKQAIDPNIQKYRVGMSIGIALYPTQSEDYNVLIKYADIAMYAAKKAGKNRYCIYEDSLPEKNEK